MNVIVNEIKVKNPIEENLENLIKSHIQAIDKLKDEIRQNREMFEDAFNNNPTYREHVEKVKEVSKAKLSVRAELSKQPSVAALKQKLSDLKFDLNEQNKTLSDLLLNYKEQTGATQLDLFDGKIGVIALTAKIVKTNKK